MASPYSKIKRAINYITSFLDNNRSDYQDAAKNIRPGQGWAIEQNENGLFNMVENMEGAMYEGLYPKLLDGDLSSDQLIIDYISTLIGTLENDNYLFQYMVRDDSGVLGTLPGIVQDLIIRALYALKETLALAEEDKQAAAVEPIKQSDILGKFQLAIITATREEYEAVKELIADGNILSEQDNDAHTYYTGFFREGEKELSVILSRTLHQGTSAASTLTTKIIWKYRPPFIAMIGHAAGNKRAFPNLKIGDVMIASTSIEYDQLVVTSKIIDSNPEYYEKENKHAIAADSTLVQKIDDFANQEGIMNSIRMGYPKYELFFEKLSGTPGKIITGNALVKNDEWFGKKADENVGTIGLDMEIHGFYYAVQNTIFKDKPLFIAIKSVSDFGGSSNSYTKEIKDHTVRVPYATYTSAAFFYRFAIRYLPL